MSPIDLRPAVQALEDELEREEREEEKAKPGSAMEAHRKWVTGVVKMLKDACDDGDDSYVLRF